MPAVRCLAHKSIDARGQLLQASCRHPLLGGRPGKNERPHPSPARTPGTPSIIMSPDRCPWTQIRLGAGTPRLLSSAHQYSRRQQMT